MTKKYRKLLLSKIYFDIIVKIPKAGEKNGENEYKI